MHIVPQSEVIRAATHTHTPHREVEDTEVFGWGPHAREASVWEACCWCSGVRKHVVNCLTEVFEGIKDRREVGQEGLFFSAEVSLRRDPDRLACVMGTTPGGSVRCYCKWLPHPGRDLYYMTLYRLAPMHMHGPTRHHRQTDEIHLSGREGSHAYALVRTHTLSHREAKTGWLAGWLAGWVAGWLAGWLGGWLGADKVTREHVVSHAPRRGGGPSSRPRRPA